MSGAVHSSYFQVADSPHAIYDGKHDLASAQTAAIYNGYVASLNATGEVYLASGSDDPYGLFYDHLALEEFPTVENLTTYLTARKCNVVIGRFRALCGTFMFSAGTLPATGVILRDNEDGTVAATGSSTIIGRCIDNAVSVGGDVDMALCLFELPSLVANAA